MAGIFVCCIIAHVVYIVALEARVSACALYLSANVESYSAPTNQRTVLPHLDSR